MFGFTTCRNIFEIIWDPEHFHERKTFSAIWLLQGTGKSGLIKKTDTVEYKQLKPKIQIQVKLISSVTTDLDMK